MGNRQSHRLSGYDYSHSSAYFITIVSQDRVDRFGTVADNEMKLNDAGKMIQSVWMNIPQRFPIVKLDAFVIMPNHIHGIILLNNDILSKNDDNRKLREVKGFPKGTLSNSIGRIIQAYKSICTNRYIKGVKMGLVTPFRKRLWQRDYYDHIIRDEREYLALEEYIINNPQSWKDDRFCYP